MRGGVKIHFTRMSQIQDISHSKWDQIIALFLSKSSIRCYFLQPPSISGRAFIQFHCIIGILFSRSSFIRKRVICILMRSDCILALVLMSFDVLPMRSL